MTVIARSEATKQLVYLGEANLESLLTLTENAGFSPAFIYEAEGFVLKRFKRF